MDHAEAITRGAVERYQLGELSEREIEEFETHFFDCTDCANELEAAAIFEENAKAVFLEKSRGAAGAGLPRARYEQARISWWTLFWQNPWNAVPSLAPRCGVVYQAAMIKPALAPQYMASYVLSSHSRGVLEVTIRPAATP